MPGSTPRDARLHFDHFGLIVADLEAGREHLLRTLQITHWTPAIADPALGVSVQFGRAASPSEPAIELIAPLGEKSPITNALRTGHRILSHLAYTTSDLDASGAQLAMEGCAATGAAHPAVAYAQQRVQFFISPLRFMIELIEAPGHQHAYNPHQGEPEA